MSSQPISQQAEDLDDHDEQNAAEDQQQQQQEHESEAEPTAEKSLKQPKRKRMKRSERAQESDESGPSSGIIKSIKLWNFMCHDYLMYNVSGHVNFITGRNGSGKSAILSGLIIGLGGKSSITSRGSSLKNFVKKGRRSAIIEITLNNADSDAYKREEYGSYIVVRRKISIDSQSTYTIKGEFGLVSNKRDELDNILDYLNIQVDNPTTILNQDLARNFLCSSSANDKYNFFLKSTQLDQIYEFTSFANTQKKQAQEIVTAKEEMIPKMEQEVKSWEKRFKSLANVDELNQKRRDLTTELAWVCVRDKELSRGKIIDVNTNLTNNMNSIDEKTASLQETAAELTQTVTNLEKEIAEISPKIQAKKQESLNYSNQVVQAKNQLNSCRNAKARLSEEISVINDQVEIFQEKINMLEQKIKEENSEIARRREEKLAKLKTERDDKTLTMENVKKDLDLTRQTINGQESEIRECYTQLTALQDKQSILKRTLEQYRKSKENKLMIFGQKIKQIVDEMERQYQQGRFREKPLGPIGSLISLKDKKFAAPVEKAIKKELYAFVVSCSHDSDVLYQISKRIGWRITIITDSYKSQMYDTSRYKVDLRGSRNAHCLMDLIDCPNYHIINTLIDQQNIEQVIVWEDHNQAQDAMMKHPPHNTKKAFTMSGDTMELNPYRFYSNTDRGNGARILTSNVDTEIRFTEEKLAELHEMVTQLQNKKKSIEVSKSANDQQLQRYHGQVASLKVEISNIKNQINEIETEPVVRSTDIDVIKDEIANQMKQRERKFESLEAVKREFEEHNRSLGSIQDKIREVNAEGKKLSEMETVFRGDLSKMSLKQNRLNQKLSTQMQRKREVQDRIDSNLGKISDLDAIIQDYTQKAQSAGERVNSERSVDSIESEYSQITRVIEAQEKEHGSALQIAQTYKLRKEKLTEIKKEINSIKTFIIHLDSAILKRITHHMELRTSLTTRASVAFRMILKNRGYTGEIKIDHESQTLEIDFRIPTIAAQENGSPALSQGPDSPASQQNGSQGRPATGRGRGKKLKPVTSDIASLSGGERSFATICFIVALWRTMNTPLRCLDEFDVFMDMINRRYSMDLLLLLAENDRSQGIQFIFLTPLTMSYLEPSPFLSIFRINKEDSQTSMEQRTAREEPPSQLTQ